MLKQIPLPECIVRSGIGVKFGWQLWFQEAELYWSRGEASLALHLMEKLISELVSISFCNYNLVCCNPWLLNANKVNFKQSYSISACAYCFDDLRNYDKFWLQQRNDEAPQFLSSALCCYGRWLSDTRRENPMTIFNDYLKKVC